MGKQGAGGIEEALDIERGQEERLGAGLAGEFVLPGQVGGPSQPDHGRCGEGARMHLGIGAGDQVVKEFAREFGEVEIQQQETIGFLKHAVEGAKGGAGGADFAVEEGFQRFPGEAQQGGIAVGDQDAEPGRGRRGGQGWTGVRGDRYCFRSGLRALCRGWRFDEVAGGLGHLTT